VAAGIGALVALAALAGCSGGSTSADPAALPRPGAPVAGTVLEADLAGRPADLVPFDDGNGHGARSADGGYTIGARQTETVVSATVPGTLPADQLVKATFNTAGSPLDAGFGVVCRWQSNNTYYRLGIGNDGTYAIARVQNGTSTVLTGGGKWVRDRQLATVPGQYSVGAECRGPTLTLFAGDRPIASVQDSTFDRAGRVGVFVETFAEANANVTVNRVRAFAYPDRSRVADATIGPWDAFTDTQRVSRRCDLLDPARAGVSRRATFVIRCGDVVAVKFPDAALATAEYARMLTRAGTELTNVKTLPNCRTRTGVLGPLSAAPPATAGTTPAGIGRVACLDLGNGTAVVWLNGGAALIGVRRVGPDDHAAWRGYGPGWPPFTAGTTGATG
jgi:hypothetical protein